MPRAFRVTFQNHSNMQKAARCIKRAAFFVDRKGAHCASAECALDFGLAQSGNVLLSQPGNRNSRAVRSFAIPAFISLNRPAGRARFRLQVQCCTFIEDDQRVRSLPGDIVPLFRPQGAGDDILTKYNVAHWSG